MILFKIIFRLYIFIHIKFMFGLRSEKITNEKNGNCNIQQARTSYHFRILSLSCKHSFGQVFQAYLRIFSVFDFSVT